MANDSYCLVTVQGIDVDDDAAFLIPIRFVDAEMPILLDINREDEFRLSAPKLYDCIWTVYLERFKHPDIIDLDETGNFPADAKVIKFLKITNYAAF